MNTLKEPNILLKLFRIVVLSVFITFALTDTTDDKVVVCYLSTWSVYRTGDGEFAIEKINPNLCTHTVHAFAGLDITQAAIKSLDPFQDLQDYGQNGYERLTGLKKAYPHLKVNLAIGGWVEGSKNYSLLVSNPLKRRKFVIQVSEFLRKYNFNGLDLHWKYPTQRGGEPSDRENFILLAKELSAEFTKHNLMLTAAIDPTKMIIDQAYNFPQLSRYIDFFHIMSFDYNGHWNNMIGYNAPLVKKNAFDVLNVTIDYIIKLGAPPSKLVLGLPFYGRCYQTKSVGDIGDESNGLTFQGPFTKEGGFLGYNEICLELRNKALRWVTKWDAKTAQVIARSKRDPFTGLIKVITFDSTRSIANKVKYAMDKQLAGVLVWSVDTDDFMGACELPDDTYADFELNDELPCRSNSSYPLLNVVNEAIVLALQNNYVIRKL